MTKEQANRILDAVRAGIDQPEEEVMLALWVTGDLG